MEAPLVSRLRRERQLDEERQVHQDRQLRQEREEHLDLRQGGELRVRQV